MFLLIGGYSAAATAAYLFLQHRGIEEVALADMLLPPRWPRYHEARGRHLIRRGLQQLDEKRYPEALSSLRLGVARAPANPIGRLKLAELLLAARRSDLARTTLLDGIPHVGPNQQYLQHTFSFLLEIQADHDVETVAAPLLLHPDPEIVHLAAFASATAAYFRGHYDFAERRLRQHRLDRSHDGLLLLCQIEWERGYEELALLQIQPLAERAPPSEAARLQLGRWLRQRGDFDAFRRICLLRQLASPDSAGPQIDLLYALQALRDRTRLELEANRILTAFSRDERALTLLAEFAANSGHPSLARRIYEHCRTQGLEDTAVALLSVEALIVAGDYRGALNLTGELLAPQSHWPQRHLGLFDSLQAVAYLGLGDTASAHLHLQNFLNRADLRADHLLAVAQRFVDIKASHEARLVLVRAVNADPSNQAVLTQLIALELSLDRLADLPARVRALVAMRKPSLTVLRAAYTQLSTDRLLFSADRDETLAIVRDTLASATQPRGRNPRGRPQRPKPTSAGSYRGTSPSACSSRSFCARVPTVTRSHSGIA